MLGGSLPDCRRYFVQQGSPVKCYRGNSFWFMRTSGYTPSTVTYICDFGWPLKDPGCPRCSKRQSPRG